MKTLNEYIENDNIDLDINDSLDLHFYAEFVLQDSMRHTITKINERYGSYIGQKELIIKVARDIYGNINSKVKNNKDAFIYKKVDLKEYSNIFFNMLEIHLHKKDTSYISGLSKYDKSNKMFDKVVITLNDENLDSLSDICSAIMHEMLHAYNNYMDNLTDAKTTLMDLTKSGTSYSKTYIEYDEDSETTGESVCKEILHDIRKFEQNAYFSELSNILELNKFNINDFENTIEAYKHAKKIFKQSGVWQRYYACYIGLKTIKSDKSLQIDFIKTYNKINGVNWTFDKIYKKLYSILENIIKRFETTISKLFCDYYQRQLNEHLKEERQKYGAFCRRSKLFVEYMQLYEDYNSELKPTKYEN